MSQFIKSNMWLWVCWTIAIHRTKKKHISKHYYISTMNCEKSVVLPRCEKWNRNFIAEATSQQHKKRESCKREMFLRNCVAIRIYWFISSLFDIDYIVKDSLFHYKSVIFILSNECSCENTYSKCNLGHNEITYRKPHFFITLCSKGVILSTYCAIMCYCYCRSFALCDSLYFQ